MIVWQIVSASLALLCTVLILALIANFRDLKEMTECRNLMRTCWSETDVRAENLSQTLREAQEYRAQTEKAIRDFVRAWHSPLKARATAVLAAISTLKTIIKYDRQ